MTNQISPVRYVVAKKKMDAMTQPDHPTLAAAKSSVLPETLKEKWYCFAKLNKDGKNKYVLVSYYDIISPLSEVVHTMQWFDVMSYKDNSVAKERFKSLRV